MFWGLTSGNQIVAWYLTSRTILPVLLSPVWSEPCDGEDSERRAVARATKLPYVIVC